MKKLIAAAVAAAGFLALPACGGEREAEGVGEAEELGAEEREEGALPVGDGEGAAAERE